MNHMDKRWITAVSEFCRDDIEFLGSKFTIGNGYFGYRGTLEEYGSSQLAACTLSELYDNANGWREIMNAPNALYTLPRCGDVELNTLKTQPTAHSQSLSLQNGLHSRTTTFTLTDGTQLTIRTQRFASIDDLHLLAMRYTITADRPATVTVSTGFDSKLWELNGPHYAQADYRVQDNCLLFEGRSGELGYTVSVAQAIATVGSCTQNSADIDTRSLAMELTPDSEVGFVAVVAVCKCTDCPEPTAEALRLATAAVAEGWESLLQKQSAAWRTRWDDFDVEIEGDDEAQLALRHSIFLLVCAAPFHTGSVAIPARGLSGQVYKGGMFWDTELYFLQMFLHCAPQVARNLVAYRIRNLAGALQKSAEEGYEGAFYPWESQETGQEGCTYYNLTDIFTGRPVRTYFRDKQIHVSAAAAYGILAYYRATGDISILEEGGAATLLQCSEFFWSYAYYKAGKDRYELLDVTGPDEYHERVNNNAYTNIMARETAAGALEAVAALQKGSFCGYSELRQTLPKLDDMLTHARSLVDKLYIPQPRGSDGIIPQYDGFFGMEDCTPEALKSRIIEPNEYLGSPTGLAVNTQIAKQADIVLLLSILGERYSQQIKCANWEYYEPRCEHGSSLSTCVYALLAAQIGKTDWAYRFFMRTAELDLKGGYKLYLGPLYIGGTHPAANGGSWMVAVQGFGGLSLTDGRAVISPKLPPQWQRLRYRFMVQGQRYTVAIDNDSVTVTAGSSNTASLLCCCDNNEQSCTPGSTITFARGNE